MIEKVNNIERRPDELKGQTIKVSTACGNMFVTINTKNEYPIFEVFAASGKTGSCSAAFVDALTRTISISLRSGVDASEVIQEIIDIRCPKSNSKNSCPEAIAKAMRDYIKKEYDEIVIDLDEFENELEMDENEEDTNDTYYYDLNYEVDDIDLSNNITNELNKDKCPECNSTNYNPAAEGCAVCLDCGYSPCK